MRPLLRLLSHADVTQGNPQSTGEPVRWHRQCGCAMLFVEKGASSTCPVGDSLLTPGYEQTCHTAIKINFKENVGARGMNL